MIIIENPYPNPRSRTPPIPPMEESNPIDDPNSDTFFDALDDFPFFDCLSNPDLEPEPESQSMESSTISHLKNDDSVVVEEPTPSPEPEGLRRRSERASANDNDNDNKNLSSNLFESTEQVVTPRERKNKILSAIKDRETTDFRRIETEKIEGSSVVEKTEGSCSVGDGLNNASLPSSSILVSLAGFVIKAIGFQITILLRFFTFPIWISYCTYIFMLDPFGIVKRVKKRITDKAIKLCGGFIEKLAGQNSVWKLAFKFGWGFFWSIYICFILFGFLINGFVMGGFAMRYLVEEPIQMTEGLNFDYTKSSPAALVPITVCPSVSCGENCKESAGDFVGGGRFIPPNHKFQLTISLSLPESDYNRNLGVFQVRVDFLTERGEVTSSSKHPCMLRFKSHVIRYLETFLKSVPLLAGYSTEAQVLNIKTKGFTEGPRPTSCLRVILEQRAEYKSGAGIPEIYSASVVLESELPLFKRILWYWKRTVYIWISMMLFMTELIFALVCCRPILIPRARRRDGSTISNSQNTVAPATRS